MVQNKRIENLHMPFTAKNALEHYLSIGINDDAFYVGTTDNDSCIFNCVKQS